LLFLKERLKTDKNERIGRDFNRFCVLCIHAGLHKTFNFAPYMYIRFFISLPPLFNIQTKKSRYRLWFKALETNFDYSTFKKNIYLDILFARNHVDTFEQYCGYSNCRLTLWLITKLNDVVGILGCFNTNSRLYRIPTFFKIQDIIVHKRSSPSIQSAENIFEVGQRLTLAHRGQSSNNLTKIVDFHMFC